MKGVRFSEGFFTDPERVAAASDPLVLQVIRADDPASPPAPSLLVLL